MSYTNQETDPPIWRVPDEVTYRGEAILAAGEEHVGLDGLVTAIRLTRDGVPSHVVERRIHQAGQDLGISQEEIKEVLARIWLRIEREKSGQA
jgi:hypothetical protein